ncbi:MAG: hypothetical protein WBW57_18850 [Candidatus Sulfotelmatobacter sp.]
MDYISAPREINMRVPDAVIKCVGFVSPFMGDTVALEYGGTAFIVAIRMDEKHSFAHLVTAKHVADAIDPGEAVIAMNAKDGAPRFLRTGSQKWFFHPTEPDSVDAAVIPFGSPRFSEYDINSIEERSFVNDEKIAEYGIGIGDEIFLTGLFTRFFGHTHLIPIVRTGNIAMLPRDRVPVKDFGLIEAYLAEGRSIGGLSGSPVFVRNTVSLPEGRDQKGKPITLSGLGPIHFLGLMHGHWDLPASFSPTEQAEAVNMGISIVVPAKKILEVLYHPELVAMRKEHLEKGKSANLPTSDSVVAKPFTKEEFEVTLKKVSRKMT